jgi:hypothetical protein
MSLSVRRNLASPALILALCALGTAILVSLFRWTLVEYLTPFLEPLLEIGVGILFLVSLIWSTVHLIRRRHDGLATAFLPVAVNTVAALIVVFVPFTELTTNLNFRFRLNDRMAVVNDVLAGKYQNQIQSAGGRGDLIALPARLSGLSSSGGEIVRFHRQSDTLVLFFDYRGILDSFSGFVYSTDDLPPGPGDFGAKFFEIERLRKNWFWVSSRN